METEQMASNSFNEEEMTFKRRIPTLVELCIQTTIDNVRYLGDVGETDIRLLKDILPHCTVDQLMHIEKSSKGRDLTPVTNKLWRRFFETKFGSETFNEFLEDEKERNTKFKWRKVYEYQLGIWEETQQKQVARLKELYSKQVDKKQSRQIQITSKVPPSSKRPFFGGFGGGGSYNKFSSGKGNLMKKAKMEFLNSHEVKAHSAMKRKAFQMSTHPVKPNGFRGKDVASGSKFSKPFGRS